MNLHHRGHGVSQSEDIDSLNLLSENVIGIAINIHKQLGPGLLESAYQQALAYYFQKNNIAFEKEKPIAIALEDIQIDVGYRADFIIENKIILEVKSIQSLLSIHEAQILTYMKLGSFKLGLLINFNEITLIKGLRRKVL